MNECLRMSRHSSVQFNNSFRENISVLGFRRFQNRTKSYSFFYGFWCQNSISPRKMSVVRKYLILNISQILKFYLSQRNYAKKKSFFWLFHKLSFFPPVILFSEKIFLNISKILSLPKKWLYLEKIILNFLSYKIFYSSDSEFWNICFQKRFFPENF